MKTSNLSSLLTIKTKINCTEVTLSFSERPDSLTKNNIVNLLLCAYDGRIDNEYQHENKITIIKNT